MISMRFSFLFLVNKKCHQSLQNSQLKVYHYLYNNIELIQRNRFWYCFCDKTIGYEKNGQKKYCLPYMLEMDKTFDAYELEKVKKCS